MNNFQVFKDPHGNDLYINLSSVIHYQSYNGTMFTELHFQGSSLVVAASIDEVNEVMRLYF